jgi:Rho GTPase-activating protein 1
MRHFKQRVRGSSIKISTVPPPPGSVDHNPQMAKAATSILYRSPLNSKSGHPIYILNAAALPDTNEVDYDTLLPYVLARLPGEEELVHGAEYEVILFAGGPVEGATSAKRNHPGVGWFLQVYHVLSRAMRKRIQRLYIVHQRTWVRMLVEVFSTVASPKFRKKIVHGMLVALSFSRVLQVANNSCYSFNFERSSDLHKYPGPPYPTLRIPPRPRAYT